MSENGMYLLLDSWGKLVARGAAVGPVHAELLQLRIHDGRVDVVAGNEIVQVIGIGCDERALKCRVVRSRNDDVVLEPLERLDPALRNNLRIPVCFESFLYPVDGRPERRLPVRSVDLSCGGIAFYAARGLEVGRPVELVLPITEQPLIVRARILRANDLSSDVALYAAAFSDLCYDEEKMIRRAVFSIQIENERA